MCNRYIYSFSYYSVPPTCTPFNPLPYTHTLAHTLCKPLPYSLHPHSLTAPPSPLTHTHPPTLTAPPSHLTLTPLRMYFPHPSYPHPLTHSSPNPLTLPHPSHHILTLCTSSPNPLTLPRPHTLTLLCTSLTTHTLTPYTLTLLHTSSPNPHTLSPHALFPEK